ncbi:MAG: cytochrome b5 domain-containing protein [Actinomycetes bacterium]
MKRFLALAAAGIVPIVVFLLLPMGTWAEITDLPMHPLIVHGVVVVLPVTAILALVAMWRPAVFTRTFTVLWALSVVSVLGVIAAISSGESLSAAVGLPDSHAAAGTRLLIVAIALAATVLTLGFAQLVRPVRAVALGARALTAIGALAALPLTYAAGHTGAEAAWQEDYAAAKEPISRDDLSLSIEEVRRHATPDDCWAVVNGVVYDLTTFVARHPAGSSDIEGMCGTDATDDFVGEHGGQGEPERWLATLRIGVLSD